MEKAKDQSYIEEEEKKKHQVSSIDQDKPFQFEIDEMDDFVESSHHSEHVLFFEEEEEPSTAV